MHQNQNNIGLAFFLNLSFTIVEVIGGLYTGSIAILSDAIHDLGDSLSLGIAYFLEKISHKKPDDIYTYGYDRFSLLGALITSFVLIGGSIFIISETIPRLFNPVQVDAQGMLLFAVLGIVFNGIAFFKTHQGHSLNEKTVSLHLLEDMLGWVAILIGSIVLLFVDFYVLDAILSLGIVVIILVYVYNSTKQLFNIFMQKVPDEIDFDDIMKQINKIDHIIKAHHGHVWTLDGIRHMMSIHIVLDTKLTIDKIISIKKMVKEKIQEFNIEHVTIECEFIEGEGDGYVESKTSI
ncbi:MAG: cation diffusion facilitator family transporter [Candidatus Izemoplasma sp.]|nr:cation diffusion facilitator family transporter [Candidatus Izemoplasma sp.]